MSLWLTRPELEELTKYKTPRKWREVLAEMRIPFRVRPLDGFPLVLRAEFTIPDRPKTRRPAEPKWTN